MTPKQSRESKESPRKSRHHDGPVTWAPTTWADVCELGRALPGMEESTSYGTPALKVRGKLVVRLREDGETVALRIGFPEREELMAIDPDAFFITDHYANYPAVVIRLAKVRGATMKRLLAETWQTLAPPAKPRTRRR